MKLAKLANKNALGSETVKLCNSPKEENRFGTRKKGRGETCLAST